MKFPVLGFTPDGDIWGFPDLDTLTSCGPRTLKEDLQIGMELVDGHGRRWAVRSVIRLGRGEPFLKWLVSAAPGRYQGADLRVAAIHKMLGLDSFIAY